MGKRVLWGGVGVAAMLGIAATFAFLALPHADVSSVSTMSIGGTTIHIEIEKTPAERERGLSGRTSLGSDAGMLFVFPQDGYYRFWMKDMGFPIDMAWISETGTIIDIHDRVAPDTYPKTFTSRAPARYVLELSTGFLENHGVKVGDTVSLPHGL